MMRTLMIVLAVLILLLVGVGFWLKNQIYTPVSVPASLAQLPPTRGVPWRVMARLLESGRLYTPYPVKLKIKKGMKFRPLVAQLKQLGLIRNEVVFILLAKLTRKQTRYQHGLHTIKKPLNALELLAELSKPGAKDEQNLVRITPGKNIWEVAAILEDRGVADRVKFVRMAFDPVLVKDLGLPGNSVEGYLFPDTYDMPRGKGARWAINTMVKRFLNKYRPLRARARTAGLSLDRVVTMASIVVREAGPGEMNKIASVLFNRLNYRDRRGRLQPMPLAMDPTTIYGLLLAINRVRLRQAKSGRDVDFAVVKNFNLKKVHLQDPGNPYNTYQHGGLPPGPIASPGLPSLRAVLEPDRTRYLYFVAKNDGTNTHHFSTSQTEHALAVNCYQKRPPNQAACRRLEQMERRP
jgi:UPF0755 protein